MDILVSNIVNHISLKSKWVYLLYRYDNESSIPIPNIFTSIEKVSEYLEKFHESIKSGKQIELKHFYRSVSYFGISLHPLDPDTYKTNIVTLFQIGYKNGELVIRLVEEINYFPIKKKLYSIYH
jgi:hypothetical protein